MATAMKCSDAEELIALAVLGALERDAATGLDAHLATCEHCRDVARDFRRVTTLLPDSLELATPSGQLRRRLMASVYAGTSGAPMKRRTLADMWRRLPQSRVFTAAASVAAAAAVALAVWGATRATGPATRTFNVVPAASQPAAQGQLTYYAGTGHSVLAVSGLPEPSRPGGAAAVYELWFVPRTGAPVPAAFMSKQPGANTWTAVVNGDVLAYQALAATIEPPEGRPQPSGAQVFSVPLMQL